jgi:hypothetical protein
MKSGLVRRVFHHPLTAGLLVGVLLVAAGGLRPTAARAEGSSAGRPSIASAPGDFGKISPANNATGLPSTVVLRWGTSAGAWGYEYCLSPASTPCTRWMRARYITWVQRTRLAPDTQYIWQVRAFSGTQRTYADTVSWWTFFTGHVPGAFVKLSPASRSVLPDVPTLTWAASTDADTYEYCISTSYYCTRWIGVEDDTSVTPGNIQPGRRYYWQVRAMNSAGTRTASGGLWSFTVSQPAYPNP